MPSVDAVILAGGRATRFGDDDKLASDLGGRTLLERVLDAVAEVSQRIVVGPRRELVLSSGAAPVWSREDPPGGGPVAGLASAMPLVRADVVLVLAGDLPWIASGVPALLAALGDPAGSRPDAAALVDPGGRVNYLAAAWDAEALRVALAGHVDPAGLAMRTLFAGRVVHLVPDAAGWGADCDTPDDLLAAAARLATMGE